MIDFYGVGNFSGMVPPIFLIVCLTACLTPLSKSKLFENSYNLYQDILYYLQHRNYTDLCKIINAKYDNISKEMTKSLNTLKKYSDYIKNTLEYPYSNGVMERNNNTCKLIKRVSFGFRNFLEI